MGRPGGARPGAEQAGALDRKGGPGHTVLMALALAVPVVKVAYTVGGGDAVREVLVGMEPANWPDVWIGMLLTDPLLASVLGVVLSRVVFALFAARGAVPVGGGPAGAARRVALTVVNPAAVGAIVACLFGPWWGLGTGVVAYLLRKGVVVEYHAGRRHRHARAGGDGAAAPPGDANGPGGAAGYRPSRGLRRAAAVEQGVALALTVLVLPVLAFVSALDGRSWTPLVRCQVTNGTVTASSRLIELSRKGSGVVGWNLDSAQISNGLGCTRVESLYVREPWWRR